MRTTLLPHPLALCMGIVTRETSSIEHLLYNYASRLYKALCNKVECGMVVQHVPSLEWLKHSHSRDGDGLRQSPQLMSAKRLPCAFGVHTNAPTRLRILQSTDHMMLPLDKIMSSQKDCGVRNVCRASGNAEMAKGQLVG